MKKNEHYKMDITDLGINGEGIGKIDGFTIFVEGGVPRDKLEVRIVKLKKNYGYGKIIKIIEKSPYRTEPKCEHYERCGGCNIQHIDYKYQLEFKRKKVKDNLERIGGFKGIEVNETIGMENPYYYRNKAQFPVGGESKNCEIGFYYPRSHQIEDIKECKIQHKINIEITKRIREFIKENNIEPYNEDTNSGIIRHILTRVGYTTGEIMICIVINAKKMPYREKLIEKLSDIENIKSITASINMKNTNVIMGDKIEVLYGEGFITDYIGKLKFEISPLSFYQVNPVQTKILYEKALEMAEIGKDDTVIDAYCGIGTISLFLAQKAKKVYGIEIIPQAIDDAKRNAEINNINNAEFIVGESEEIIPKLYEDGIKADVIVVDPPRKGCDVRLLDVIEKMKPRRVVYVSCDCATLARDLKVLNQKGYEVDEVQPVDQFCMTGHVETVVLMSRVKK